MGWWVLYTSCSAGYSVWMINICSFSMLSARVDILYNTGSDLKIIRGERNLKCSQSGGHDRREEKEPLHRVSISSDSSPSLISRTQIVFSLCLSSLPALYKPLTWETDRRREEERTQEMAVYCPRPSLWVIRCSMESNEFRPGHSTPQIQDRNSQLYIIILVILSNIIY